MKIISDFKDYYDHGMAFGIDEGIVYERFQKTIHPPKRIERKQGGVLGFCGEFWEVKQVNLVDTERYSYQFRKRGREIVTYEDKAKQLIEEGWMEGSPIFENYPKDQIRAYYWIRSIKDITNMEWVPARSWNRYNYTHWNNWLKSIFTEYSVPSFFVEDSGSYETTLNPITMNYGLQKLKDPVEAFQELSTFIPSLSIGIEPIEMTDEELGKSKGFDEFSFRNNNTKKKPKKF